MRPTAKDPSQFEFPVGPKVPYEDPKRCVSLRAATKREACKSTKLCTKQGHGWKLFISGTPTKRTPLAGAWLLLGRAARTTLPIP
jgi:hypothetical protein